MSRPIPAIYDAGVFRPLEPVELADGTQVELHLQKTGAPDLRDTDRETQNAWCDYLDRMEALPDSAPRDDLTNRDHDRIIYGG